MLEEERGNIDYDECGSGPIVVLVPGSCSTGAAWRPLIAAWDNRFRCVTTSLLGYGQTAERRSAADRSISHEVDIIQSVIRKAGGGVHLVGYSFGALVALAAALRGPFPLASLTIIEPPVVELLRAKKEFQHYHAFRRMTAAYRADYEAGNEEAIAAMIDFYGGAGTFASWPQAVREYAVQMTPINLLDWESVYGFRPMAALSGIRIPVLVVMGEDSHPAMQRANMLLSAHLRHSELVTIQKAAHFMLASHPQQLAQLIARHVGRAETGLRHPGWRAPERDAARPRRCASA